MGNIQTNRVQIVNNQVNQVIEDCLSNSIVLRRILEHFSNTELLELSFVNKFWNYEARSVMRKRGDLVAHIDTFSCSDPYKNLKAFGQDLWQMNVAPFSGLSINLWCLHGQKQRDSSRNAVLDPTYEAIVDQLPLKYFTVRLFGNWCDHEDCAALLLIKRVLHHFSRALEILSLHVEAEKQIFIDKFVRHCNFPRLKKLKLYGPFWPSDESYINFIKAFLSRAPNLQELHNSGDINLLGKLLDGSSAVLVYSRTVRAPFDEISDSVISALRLGDMQLEYTGPEFNIERFNRTAPILLQACCSTTLHEVTVDAVLAVSLMSLGVCLKNVKKLQMNINYRQFQHVEPRILLILKDFDFTRIFPSLREVKLNLCHHFHDLSPDHMNTIIEKAKAVLNKPLPDRAVNIKKLSINGTLSNVTVPFFGEMFPSIEKLEVDSADEVENPVGPICKHWVHLKELTVLRVSDQRKGANSGGVRRSL